jgi:hypothetical protein
MNETFRAWDVDARAGEDRLDFMAVTALQKPDFRTISNFRKRHLTASADLSAPVLALCRRAHGFPSKFQPAFTDPTNRAP